MDIRFDIVLNTDQMPQFKDCQLYPNQRISLAEKRERTKRHDIDGIWQRLFFRRWI